jgi:Tfp pilus assembly protein PilF
MLSVRRMLVVASALFLLTACETVKRDVGELLKTHPFQAGPAEQKLSSGVKSYEEGDYKSSHDTLHDALDMGLTKGDQVVAHKYLAFVDCIGGREKQCRDEFRKALEIDPSFDLKPAEAGHPIWGPVFRSVKDKLGK